MKKYILAILCFFVCSVSAFSQTQTVEATGTVVDSQGIPLIGVSITVKDAPGLGVVTDVDGKYKIKVRAYSWLIYSYVGFENQEHVVKDQDVVIDVRMTERKETILNEVAITGMGPQKKVTLTGAITTVDVGTLKTASSNVVNALAGNVAGVLAMQTSGQPGNNTSEFWIRGISTFGGGAGALVLVDGFERNMSEINIEDIETFTVLKDASTTAIYGSRGANGVILITSKRGAQSKVQVDAKAEYTFTTRTFTPKFVDGNTYASLLNEALTTRNRPAMFNDDELMMIREGLDPDLFPNMDWMDLMLKDWAPTYRASVNIKGGGAVSRYYLSGSYINEGGMYNVDKTMKDYDTNANYERWNYRLNLDIDVTKKTVIKVGVAGSLEKQNQAGASQDDMWHALMGYNPILTPAVYSNGYYPAYSAGNGTNPWVTATQTGYTEFWKNNIQTNITLEQNLDMVTQGLKFNGRFGYDTYNENWIQRLKWPEQWRAQRLRDSDGNMVYSRVVREELMKQYSRAEGIRNEFLEGEIAYNRTFGDHTLGSIIKYTQNKKVNTTNVGGDILAGVDRRSQGLAGNFSYNYKNRYYVNFNFGYNGSENFAKGNRFGFFPAYSAAWNIAEESFIKNKAKWIEMLKIRYSYGKVGNDYIATKDEDIYKGRFPFLENFGSNGYYNWGDIRSDYGFNGLAYTQVASNGVTWEIAKKHDVGLDIYLSGDKFGLTVDYFNERREGIYMMRKFLPEMVGIQGGYPRANIGGVKTEGFDGNFSYVEKIGNVNLTLRGNFTYSKNDITDTDELFTRYPYLKEEGFRVDQARGLIALGLFKDYDDIRDSPAQWFGHTVMPGDIKYKDVNGDGIINDDDMVPIGSTTKPNLIYGFGVSASWNGFDVNLHFQGAGKSQFFIDGFTVYPFQSGDWGNILTDIPKSNRWILGENEDINAKYPRLSYGGNSNNYRRSTYWLRDGSYLRLKTLEVGYTIPKSITNKILLNNVRVYFLGQNLLTFSKFKLWDPEMGSSNGQKYPLPKTFTLGLTLSI